MASFDRDFDDDDDATTVRADFPPGPSAGLSRSQVVPLAIIVVLLLIYGAGAGYWLVTGQPPSLVELSPRRLALQMPPMSKGELLRPPGARDDVPAADVPSEVPADVPAEPPAAPPPVPQVAIPEIPDGPHSAPQFASLPPPKAEPPLLQAPVPELANITPAGPLPVIAPDGRQPWQVYARPFADGEGRPRIAVIVGGLGLSAAVSEAAIARLPAEVTLAFSPYAKDLDAWLKRARAAGHEVMVELPMQARRFPERDAGPLALHVDQPPDIVTRRLREVLVKGTGYVGLLGSADTPFAASPQAAPVMAELKRRGLLYVGDPRGVPADLATRPAFIDPTLRVTVQPFRAAIDARLRQVLLTAQAHGKAVVVADALPVAIDRLSEWLLNLGKEGAVAAPVSALVTPPASETTAQ